MPIIIIIIITIIKMALVEKLISMFFHILIKDYSMHPIYVHEMNYK